ncbi:MAG: hypothetical protein AABZ53_10850 [Planctomycetota bacterium]
MNKLFDTLFGTETLKFADAGVTIDWTRPIPPWGWLLIAIAAALAARLAYRNMDGGRIARALLASLRVVLLLLIAVLISGPRLSQETQSIEHDWVVVLADRSRSMTVADVPIPSPTPPTAPPSDKRQSRDLQLHNALLASAEMWKQLAADRNVLWLGFDVGAFELASDPGAALPSLGSAKGRRTNINASIEQAYRLVAAKPMAGIVLLSDGRTGDPPTERLIAQLRGRQIPVFAVPLGSATPGVDLSVRRADGPAAAFVSDEVPVVVEIQSVGVEGGGPPQGETKVQLIDKATARVLDEQTVVWPQPDVSAKPPDEMKSALTLVAKPDAAGLLAGESTWVVKVVGPKPDVAPTNDTTEIRVMLVDRPIRVLYFDGYPRWEYRYLKNLLVREKSIRSSALLLAAQRKFIQEGSDPIVALPRTAEEWRQYDVVILGDLRPEMFSAEQLEQLRDHVARDGAGLLWIAGPSSMPGAWRGTAVADLVPFSIFGEGAAGEGGRGVRAWLEPVLVHRSAAADRLGVLRLGDKAEEAWPPMMLDAALPWTTLRYAQRIERSRLKPAAETLATAAPAGADELDRSPLIITMRYGAGRSVYVGTDETWRWRYGRGETLPERFWLPIIRMLARQGLAGAGRPAMIEVSPPKAIVDQPVQITVRLLDQSMIDAKPKSIQVRVGMKPETGAPAGVTPSPIELRLIPQDAGGGQTGIYSATWLPSEPGSYQVDVIDALLARAGLLAGVDAAYADDEMRTPQTDHALLQSLAEKTSGAVVNPARLADLATLLPNHEVRLLGTPRLEALWDKPVVWVLLMVILALEWAGRRLIRLA